MPSTSANAALGWVEVPELRKSVGGLLYYQAQSGDVLNLNVPATLEQARKELEQGLAEEPADSLPWAWLSDIRQVPGRPSRCRQGSAAVDPVRAPRR